MATISSKQVTRQTVNPIQGPVILMLIGALVFLALVSALETLNAPRVTISGGNAVSFASDLEYWNANCIHGWSSDAKCDGIASRAQVCSESTGSAYCSDYDTYMQQVLGQK